MVSPVAPEGMLGLRPGLNEETNSIWDNVA